MTALIDYLTVMLKYIDIFQFLLVGYSQLLVGPTLGYAPEVRHLTNLEIYLCDHAHQLEYTKQYSMIA